MKNLNLTGRLAGMTCILLVLFAAGASGQAFLFPVSALIPDPAASQEAPTAEAGTVDQIVLLDGLPVSAFRLQLGSGRTGLDETQGDQVRAYSRHLEAEQRRFVAAARRQGIALTVQRTFSFLLNGLAVSLPAGDVERLAALPGVSGVYPDSQVHLELADSVSLIGADQVWPLLDADGLAVTGQGISVAVIDTGIDYTHPDLGGCFGPGCKVVGGYDLYNNDADPLDDNGHGTHCAGIVAADGGLRGVAPGASLYAFKVLNAYGAGAISVIITGIERAADPDQDPATEDAVDIISMSLGLPGAPDDPWPQAVDAAAEQGIVVAVSAGNSGPVYNSVESPGLARLALSVGAVDKSDQIAAFSSRGPIPGYDGWLKPDILAPGVDIISTYLGGIYASSSGTSMAAPHGAGAAALVKQMQPTWSPEQVKASLMNTAVGLGLDVHTQGAGRLQVDRAVAVPGLVTPASISFGTVDISQPLWSDTGLLWLENVTGTARNYSLSGETLLPGSVTISVEPTSMTLAPGERRSFSAVVAVDTLQTPPDLGRDQGQIRIQQGDTVLVVPFAFQAPSIFDNNRSLPFGLQTSYGIALHDLDGDGDLDAFVGNTSYYDNPANTVWFNDGAGNFTDSGQRLGDAFTWDVALGDLDGDGDSDVFAANSELNSGEPDEIWLNNGHGYFTDSGQRLGDTLSRAAALGDLDGDGDLDAFIANGIPDRGPAEADTVWLNDGHGAFSNSGQALGSSAGLDVALGDLDGDDDLDAFIASGDPQRVRSIPNEVWLNDGHGFFANSGQNLGSTLSQAGALGDLDGDSDLDAFIANGGPAILDGQPDEVWINNGNGTFSSSGQSLGSLSSYGAALADLHQDGTLDVFVAGHQGGNRVWLNDGNGVFTFSSPGFGTEHAADAALGDVDGDGDVDALVANAISKPNRLWLNRGSGGPALERLAPPSELTAIAPSGDSINLAWTDNALGETSYRVERSSDGVTGWAEIAVLPANSGSYADASVGCGETHYYRVRAHRDSGGLYSAYSHLASAQTGACNQPAAPTGLIAVAASQSRIDLVWIDNATDETAYRVERSPDGTTGWLEIASLAADATAYSDASLPCGTNYAYRVRAYRAADEQFSSYSNTSSAETAMCPLPAPTGLAATAVSSSQIDLVWEDAAVDETAFYVERSADGLTGWAEIVVLPAGSTAYSDSSLSCDEQYFYRVRAYRVADETFSLYSSSAEATTHLCPLPAPNGLTASTVSHSQIDLAWIDNALDETSYHVERSADGLNGWAEIVVLPADSTAYSDSSLSCDEQYFYRVRAYRAADETFSSYSSTAEATTHLCPLPAPSSLTASAVSHSQIDLAWIDNATDETAYSVEQSLDGATGWGQIALLPADTTTYSDAALSCSMQHYYRVRAFRAVDQTNSLYSNTASATTDLCTLAAPTGLSAVMVSGSQIDLTWLDNTADETAYRVERSPDGTIGWVEIALLPANTTTYSDTSLACGTGHAYRVRAYREADDQYSSYSNISSAVTDLCPLPAPTELSATAVSSSQIDLVWDDTALDETAYHVERSPDGVTGWAEIVVLPANLTAYSDSSLSCAEQYFYRVRAYRAADETFSLYSSTAEATTHLCPLPAPSSLTASTVSHSQIDLAWIDNATDETAYSVEKSLDGVTGWGQIALLPADTTTYSDAALSCSAQHFYRVRAYRAVDQTNSLYSNIASATTDLCTLAAPTGLSAVMVSNSQIDLTWTDHATDETAYRVERSLDGTTGWMEIALLSANTATYSDTSLTCGTSYTYRIRAYREDDDQYSSYSNISSADADMCPLPTPTGLSATAVSSSQIDLVWDDTAVDETAFHVERSPDGVTGWAEIAVLTPNATAYSDGSLSCAVQYFYRVRAYRAVDQTYSLYSATAEALTQLCPLPAPTGLTATTVSSSQIDLAWVDSALDETAYHLERSADGLPGWAEIAVLTPNATAYSDIGLSCGKAFSYRVRAYRAADGIYSLYSATAEAMTQLCPLPAPTGLTATAVSSSQIDLAWADSALDETAYHLERSADGVTAWAEIAVLTPNATAYSDIGLSCGTASSYRVRAYRAADEIYSLYSATSEAVTQLCPLPPPSSLTASPISQSRIDLDWIDNATDETAYSVERSLDGTMGWEQIALLPADTTTYSDAVLSCSGQYYYRVRAYRAVDQTNSLYSNATSAATDLCTLAAPTGLSAVMVSDSQIDLAWLDNIADETAFRVERSLDGVTGWTEIIVLPENSTAYSDTGLACSTEYHFRVRAYRDSDEQFSQYSRTTDAETGICAYRVYLPLIFDVLP